MTLSPQIGQVAMHSSKSEIRRQRLIQLMVLGFFITLYVGSLGMIYLAPFIGGNTSLIGTILGCADASASVWSGMAAYQFGETRSFGAFAALAVGAITLVYWMADDLLGETAILGYTIYYVGMVGWGGCINLLFIISEQYTPPEWLGATLSLGMASGLLAASLSPQIVLLKMPLPLYVFNFLLLIDCGIVLWLANSKKKVVHSADFKTELKNLMTEH